MSGLPPPAPGCASCAARDAEIAALRAQHVPIERCRDLIDATGAAVSAGFIHSCLRVAADLAAGVIKLIAALRIPGPKNSTAQHPGRELLEFCRDREDAVLWFTTDTQVWPTNNISERGVRPLKTQQKISGRLTSEDTTQNRLDIRSYIDTARKHGHDAMTVLRSLFTETPWHPPEPAAISL
jgi:Transposase IS66 family